MTRSRHLPVSNDDLNDLVLAEEVFAVLGVQVGMSTCEVAGQRWRCSGINMPVKSEGEHLRVGWTALRLENSPMMLFTTARRSGNVVWPVAWTS